jgi:hypothetical protein
MRLMQLHLTCNSAEDLPCLLPAGKGEGKTIPLQAWTGPEDSRRLRIPDSMTVGT